MNRALKQIGLAVALGGATVACAQTGGGGAQAPADECPIMESRDWRAWVDAEPGGPRMLRVEGEVDMPTPGYRAVWRVGPADRRLPPAQHLILDLTPPLGLSLQVITPTRLSYAGEAVYPAYRAIVVRCGDRVLAEIDEVPEAQ